MPGWGLEPLRQLLAILQQLAQPSPLGDRHGGVPVTRNLGARRSGNVFVTFATQDTTKETSACASPGRRCSQCPISEKSSGKPLSGYGKWRPDSSGVRLELTILNLNGNSRDGHSSWLRSGSSGAHRRSGRARLIKPILGVKSRCTCSSSGPTTAKPSSDGYSSDHEPTTS